MSTHNICFCREIRKILCGYPLLSVAMVLACVFQMLPFVQYGTLFFRHQISVMIIWYHNFSLSIRALEILDTIFLSKKNIIDT